MWISCVVAETRVRLSSNLLQNTLVQCRVSSPKLPSSQKPDEPDFVFVIDFLCHLVCVCVLRPRLNFLKKFMRSRSLVYISPTLTSQEFKID